MILQNYKTAIFELLDENKVAPDSEHKFLSMYLSLEDFTKNDVSTVVKGNIDNAFSESPDLEEDDNLKQLVIEVIEDELRKVKKYNKGLSIFIELNPEATKKEEVSDQLVVVNMHRYPETESGIGEVYDLSQLVWIAEYDPRSIVVDLQFKKCNIYTYEDRKLNLIESFENEHIYREEKEYQEIKRTDSTDEFQYGTGESNQDRKENQFAQHFFNDLSDAIKKLFPDNSKYKYLIIYHSEDFSFMQEKISEVVSRIFGFTPIIKAENFTNKSDIKEATISETSEFEETLKADLLSLVKEDPEEYAKGWEKVAEAANQRKIDILFIKPGSKEGGYIKPDRDFTFIYSQAKKESIKVIDIAPWLVKNVLQSGGRVIIVDKEIEEEEGLESDVLAKLRF